MNIRSTAALLATGIIALSAPSAQGQSVLVRVTAQESGDPIAGAFVSLIDDNGRVLRSALTDSLGQFLFKAPGAGEFRARAQMIGRRTQISDPHSIQKDETVWIEFRLPIHAIPLAEIRVEADQRCRIRPDDAPEISRVWEEARKALTVQAWTEDEGLYRLEISIYQRELDRNGRFGGKEDRQETIAVTRTPFVSLPPEDLMTGGFIRPLDLGGFEYYGPDAALLLSDLFLDTHCLQLTRSPDNPEAIGLAFKPVEVDSVPDIMGTIWLDQETASLQYLEYGYTWSPFKNAEGVANGRVDFHAMPSGAWIISRWWIRAPRMQGPSRQFRTTNSSLRVVGILETGGEVTGVSPASRR